MSDSKTEGASGSSLDDRRCGVCGRDREVPGGCWRTAEDGHDQYYDTHCYQLGYERLRSLINEEPRRQAPPDALAQARAEGRAAALDAALAAVRALHPGHGGFDTRVGECVAAILSVKETP